MQSTTDNQEQKKFPRNAQFRDRLYLISGIAAYVALFQWMYNHYLYPTWDYFGFHSNPPGAAYLALAWLLSVVPGCWMPIELTRPSQLAHWILYITVYIPSMFVPLYAGLESPDEISVLMLAFAVGFAILGVVSHLPLLRFQPAKLSNKTFWKWFGGIAAALAIWLIAAFHSHLQFLSFNDIYDLRDLQSDLSEGNLVNFAFMLMTGAFSPFLMGYGLFYKRKWMFLAGVSGQLLVYSVAGTKGSILSILFLSGFYLLFQFGKRPFGLKLIYGTLVLVGGLCLSFVLAGYDPAPLGLQWVALFVVLMRTFSLNGLMTAWYFDFFQTNPHTWYSHIRGVNWLMHYPYSRTVALEIGSVYMGGNDADPTTHFWAIDGIGAMGLGGVVLISIFCALVFWLLDSAAQRHDPRLAALVTCYAAYNIANISIFTSLYSGGLTVLIAALYLLPREASSLQQTETTRTSVRRAKELASGRALPIPGYR